MSDKPKFGVDAAPQDTPESEPTPAPQAEAKPTFGVGATPQSDDAEKPSFGAQAAASTPKKSKSLGEWIVDLFKMQPTDFWVKQYLYAIVAAVLMMMMQSSNDASSMWIIVVNTLLYPFTVTILQEIGRGKGEKGTLSSFFFGFSVGMIGDSLWWIVIYGLIRVFIFMLKFLFSFLIGTIGLIYMISQAKKLNR